MHTGAKEAAKLAKLAKVKKLVLTHFSRRYVDAAELEDEAREFFKDSVAAKDFMRMEIREEKEKAPSGAPRGRAPAKAK